MIHGGLSVNLKENKFAVRPCCIRKTPEVIVLDETADFWNNKKFISLRNTNKQNVWDPGCDNCRLIESSGQLSLRNGMNQGLEINDKVDLDGPARLDLMFDISCNLACRTCSPLSSTTWQKHLKENNQWSQRIFSPKSKHKIIDVLKKINLSNLRQVVFGGGETLLGQEYWDVAEYIVNNVPGAKKNITISFQTNGTQTILEKNYKIIDQAFLVKLNVSLDGIGNRFEYLRWPASWQQVTENLFEIRNTAPSNAMFVIEETVSIFNILYGNELKNWILNNFNSNREGDAVDHSKHLARGLYNVQNLTADAVKLLSADSAKLVSKDWVEDSYEIKKMIEEIKKIDSWRGESFKKTFPELAECYSQYL